jgi:subtilisin
MNWWESRERDPGPSPYVQNRQLRGVQMRMAPFLVLPVFAVAASVASAQPIPDRYIAVCKDTVRDLPAAAQTMAARHGVTVGYVYEHALRGFAFAGSSQAAAALARRAEIDYVEQEQWFYAVGNLPTGIDRADVDVALPIAQGGGEGYSLADSPVTVAVLDTGADPDHPDLNVIGGIRFYTRGLRVSSDSNYADGNGHGTHVSGTIGARDNGANVGDIHVVGVAPGIPIYAVKVLGDNGSGSTAAIIAGIDHVIATRESRGIAVANMSLGGGYSTSLNAAVKKATDAGIVFVVAAGNDGADAANYSPASEPSAITVSALADSDGQPGGAGPGFYSDGVPYTADDTLAPFSNHGKIIDICAPGVLILSTVPDDTYDDTYSGTSMAAPHVTGAAALYIDAWLFAQETPPTVADVTDALLTSGWQSGDPSYVLGGDPDTYPEPLLNVGALMNAGAPPANNPPVVTIILPADGAVFASGAEVAFSGSAWDVEDEDLTASLVWASDRVVGPIGTGGSFSTKLSDGTHVITASVTDSGGRTGSAGITVTVQASSSGDTTPPVISGVTSTRLNAKKFKITWTTDEPATSKVSFDGGDTHTDSTLVTSHSMTFSGTRGTTYTYYVASTDGAGNPSEADGPHTHQQ